MRQAERSSRPSSLGRLLQDEDRRPPAAGLWSSAASVWQKCAAQQSSIYGVTFKPNFERSADSRLIPTSRSAWSLGCRSGGSLRLPSAVFKTAPFQRWLRDNGRHGTSIFMRTPHLVEPSTRVCWGPARHGPSRTRASDWNCVQWCWAPADVGNIWTGPTTDSVLNEGYWRWDVWLGQWVGGGGSVGQQLQENVA